MTTSTEEITRFIPLTGNQRFWLRRVASFVSSALFVNVAFTVAFGLIILKKVPGNPLTWRDGVFFSFVALQLIWLLSTYRRLAKNADRATEMLKLENQAVLYCLVPRATSADGHTYYITHSVSPDDIGTLRVRLEANFNMEYPLLNDSVFAVILPLRRGANAEIYVFKNKKFERIEMSQMRMNVIEACWGANVLSTRVLLADKESSSGMEMPIDAALHRLYVNRHRIEGANLDFLWHHMESLLSEVETVIAGLREKVAKLTADLGQNAADRAELVGAIVIAITELSNHERFCRSRIPAKEVGMALVRTMLACPPASEHERARVTLAAATFERK